MASDSKKGFLSEVFNGKTFAKFALWSIPMFFIFGYVDNMIFDPFFFEPIHGSYTNVDITAWKAFLNDKLGFLHNLSGFTGKEGFLQSEFMQSILEPYKANFDVAAGYTPTTNETEIITPQGPIPNTGNKLPPLKLAPPATG